MIAINARQLAAPAGRGSLRLGFVIGSVSVSPAPAPADREEDDAGDRDDPDDEQERVRHGTHDDRE
jgi:hypothetical protein